MIISLYCCLFCADLLDKRIFLFSLDAQKQTRWTLVKCKMIYRLLLFYNYYLSESQPRYRCSSSESLPSNQYDYLIASPDDSLLVEKLFMCLCASEKFHSSQSLLSLLESLLWILLHVI